MDVISAHRRFFDVLQDIIPCEKCRVHFGAYLFEHSATLDEALHTGGPALMKWVHDLHNTVNARTGARVLNESEVTDLYSALYGPSDEASVHAYKSYFLQNVPPLHSSSSHGASSDKHTGKTKSRAVVVFIVFSIVVLVIGLVATMVMRRN